MASRHAVLLTPLLSSRPVQPLSCTQITRETPLIPIFVFKSLRTLSFSVSCKSCVCHSYANGRGGYQQFPTWSESLAACNPSLTSINRPPLVQCVDSSSPLQLSTFNRVSCPSSRLTLSQRSAKSFTIRTYEKFSRNLFRIRTYKNRGLGSFPASNVATFRYVSAICERTSALFRGSRDYGTRLTILFGWKIPPAETASAPRAERPRWHRVAGNAGAAVREL